MNKIVAVSKTSGVDSCCCIEILVDRIFGLVVNLGENLFFRYAFDNSEVYLAVLDVYLVLCNVRSENSVLHDFIQLNFVLYKCVCCDWHLNIFGWNDNRSLSVLICCNRNQICAVSTEIKCILLYFDKINSCLLVGQIGQVFGHCLWRICCQ